MKKPVALFTSIAAIAAAALGTTLYVNKAPDGPMTVAAPVEAEKTPEAPKVVEAPKVAATAPAAEAPAAPAADAPAAPAAEAPAAPAAETPQQQAAVTPAQPQNRLPLPLQTRQMWPCSPHSPKQRHRLSPKLAPAPAAALPSFDTVRVETTGDAIIAGRAEPDSDVTVKWNGNIVGTTKANADGSFVLVPANPLKTVLVP